MKRLNSSYTEENNNAEKNARLSWGNINTATELLEKDLYEFKARGGIEKKQLRHHTIYRGPLVEALPGMNNFDYTLKHDKKVDQTHRNRLVETLSGQFEKPNDEKSIDTLFDIIILTGNTTTSIVQSLNNWRPWIENIHLIIIQQGSSSRQVELPSWCEYELYTKVEVEAAVGSDNLWMFDMDSNSPYAANFGFLIADRDFVFLLDLDSIPVMVEGNANKPNTSHNLLHLHAKHLLKPSLIYYYNSPDHNPFTETTDFKRGYPYSLRQGIV